MAVTLVSLYEIEASGVYCWTEEHRCHHMTEYRPPPPKFFYYGFTQITQMTDEFRQKVTSLHP